LGFIARIKRILGIKTRLGPQRLAVLMAAAGDSLGLRIKSSLSKLNNVLDMPDGFKASDGQWAEALIEIQAAFHALAAKHVHRFLQGESFRRFGAAMVVATSEMGGYVGEAFQDISMERRVHTYLVLDIDTQTRADLETAQWILKGNVDVPSLLLVRLARALGLNLLSLDAMTVWSAVMYAVISLRKNILNDGLLPVPPS